MNVTALKGVRDRSRYAGVGTKHIEKVATLPVAYAQRMRTRSARSCRSMLRLSCHAHRLRSNAVVCLVSGRPVRDIVQQRVIVEKRVNRIRRANLNAVMGLQQVNRVYFADGNAGNIGGMVRWGAAARLLVPPRRYENVSGMTGVGRIGECRR